jgi:hypothetical protein
MSEEPPEDNFPEGYGIEPLPYMPPSQAQQTSPAIEENASREASQSVSEEITRPVSPVVPSPTGSQTTSSRKKSRRTLWMAGGISGILLLIIAGIVIIAISRSTPDKTLGTFCSALKGGDYQTAYNQFSPKLRSVIAETAFATIFAHDKVTACTYSAINETGNSATAGLELVHASNGTNKDGITLARDDKNEWKIDDFYRQA